MLASIAAEVVSELLDTEMYELWVKRVAVRYPWARRQWMRVLSSNAASLPVDSLIFAWGAFGGVLPAAIAARMILEGAIPQRGVLRPVLPEIYDPVLDELADLEIECKEERSVY